MDGLRITSAGDVAMLVQRHKPGDTIPIVFVDRTGVAKTARVTLGEDPHIDVAVQAGALTPAQKAFRDAWLGGK